MTDFNLEKIKKLWRIENDLKFVRNVANQVYFSPSTKTYIRITSNKHRSVEQIRSELDWIKHVSNYNIQTVQPIKSINNEPIETIKENGKAFHVTCFTKAEGERPLLEKQNADFFIKWGKITGRLHKASKEYNPKNIEKRPDWFSDELHKDIRLFRKIEDGPIYDKSIELENLFQNLPKDENSFGLIHADLHTGNFNIDSNRKITLFDFDDSLYHWFIFDIAIIHWNFDFYEFDRTFAKKYFLEGYKQENELDSIWFDHIESFHTYRIIQIYYFAIKEIENSKSNKEIIEKFRHHLDSTYNRFNLKDEHKRF